MGNLGVQLGGFSIAMAKKSFILHLDSLCILDKMSPEQAGIFIKAIYFYQINGELPPLDFSIEMAITPFVNQFKRDEESYQKFVKKQVENGKKGGRPNNPSLKKETQKTQAFLEKPKKAYSDSVSVNDSVNDNDSVNVNVNVSKNESDIKSKLIKPHLFSESPFFEFQKFESAFTGTDYEVADLRIYYESVKNWSESEGAKKLDWVATARNFMLRDLKENKLIYKNGQKQQQQIDVKAQRDEALQREFERRYGKQ